LQRSELNGEQQSPVLDGSSDVLVMQDVIYATSSRQMPSHALKRFRMLAQGSCRVGNRFFQGVARRKASLEVGKPDAERAVGLFLNDRYVLCRHRE
jgi:hypothetical protein